MEEVLSILVLEVNLDLQAVEDYEDDPNDPDSDIDLNDADDDEDEEDEDDDLWNIRSIDSIQM